MGNEIDVPADYLTVLEAIKVDVRATRQRALRVVNTELLELYWRIGRTILDRQDADGWGAKVISRLSADLRREFPDMTGLSRSNLHYMRSFAEAWPGDSFVPQPVGQMPWGHVRALLEKLPDAETRDWYAAQAVQYGWSRNVLLNQIKNQTIAASAPRRRTSRPSCRPATPNSPNN